MSKWVVALVLSMLVAGTRHFFYLLIAALTLDFVFAYLVIALHYGNDFEASAELTSMVFDLFGACAEGFSYGGNGCIPL